MLYYNIVFKGDGEMQDSSCHLYLLSKKKPTKENPKKGDGREGRCHCYKLLLLLLGAAAAIVAAAPAGVAHMPTLCICAHPPFPPFVCPCTRLRSSAPALAFGCMCGCVLVYAGPRYLVVLVWPLFMLVHAHLGSFGLCLCSFTRSCPLGCTCLS